MAITKTSVVQRVEVYPAVNGSAAATSNYAHPSVMIVFQDTLDDPSDSDLPIINARHVKLNKFVEDGGDATDYSSMDSLIVNILDGIWS